MESSRNRIEGVLFLLPLSCGQESSSRQNPSSVFLHGLLLLM